MVLHTLYGVTHILLHHGQANKNPDLAGHFSGDNLVLVLVCGGWAPGYSRTCKKLGLICGKWVETKICKNKAYLQRILGLVCGQRAEGQRQRSQKLTWHFTSVECMIWHQDLVYNFSTPISFSFSPTLIQCTRCHDLSTRLAFVYILLCVYTQPPIDI